MCMPKMRCYRPTASMCEKLKFSADRQFLQPHGAIKLHTMQPLIPLSYNHGIYYIRKNSKL